MFSAIFGNFLFSSSSSAVAVVRSEEEMAEAVQTSKYSEASTQTSNLLVENDSSDNNTNNEQTHSSTEANTSQQLDWVIVDKTETECMDSGDEPKENLVEMNNVGGEAVVAATQEDVLLGSFFDKNATCEDEERYKCYKHLENNDELSNEPADEDTEAPANSIDMQQTDNLNQTAQVLEPVKNETWLITPLPCLTSITELSQQRSMIDNDPLENLLIEHPSMSIFMSATAPPTTTTTTTISNNNTPLAISKRRNRKPISAHKSKFMQSVIKQLLILNKLWHCQIWQLLQNKKKFIILFIFNQSIKKKKNNLLNYVN